MVCSNRFSDKEAAEAVTTNPDELCLRSRCYRVWLIVFLGVFFLTLHGHPCDAHKINIFATTEGETIAGYAYSRAGERIRHQTVLIQNVEGETLGQATTDENGEFTFQATFKGDHVLVLELADGHRASFTATADELPDTLPLSSTASEYTASEHNQTTSLEQAIFGDEKTTEKISAVDASSASQRSKTQEPVPMSSGVSPEEIEKIVDKAVSKQLRPLRGQLKQYEEKIRLHDILGGIGYIIGLMGLWYFVSTQRTREK